MEAELCLVEWDDPSYDPLAEGLPERIVSKSIPVLLRTPGWYLGEDEGSIHLAHDFYVSRIEAENEFRGDLRIPKSIVTQIWSIPRGELIWSRDAKKVSKVRKAQPKGTRKAVGDGRGRRPRKP